MNVFIQAISKETSCEVGVKKGITIVYTPLNGAGGHCVRRVLEGNGFQNVSVVEK